MEAHRIKRRQIPASYFGVVLGVAGLGQAWRSAVQLWHLPSAIGEALLAMAGLIWAALIIGYVWQSIRNFEAAKAEFLHPVQGGTPALIAVSTLLIAIAVIPYSMALAWLLTIGGIAWNIGFALWHTGTLWQGGRNSEDMLPTLYLPTVAGNLTTAAALGALGSADWGWIFLGAGFFSWLALESLVIHRLWHSTSIPAPQRPLIGIQFAPPVVCAMAWLALSPGSTDHWLLMLWGYGLFQLLLGLRLGLWLGVQPFIPAYWAYTFGVAAATVSGLKLAQAGIHSAQVLAVPVFVGANVFIGYLVIRTVHLLITSKDTPQRATGGQR
ncbi:dicarboxylate transporter/tellurite-resistance protein TehA [Xanthomonas euvesicatoria]|jgi:tellurite resistance protein|uniref:Tellurite-resistance/dicarboxylate transporter family protein n=4 Tax=Lysobacterales TaxID=135614 RepID=Q3BT64_XANE5|nr:MULTISPECIES: dicarboxylate transporter/tellurite-resistance protein TehA [Pseudomonadota]ABM41584.1 C4-dicarboxylate transporter/malic acid transport protein [Acidovorax sp. JS42]MCW0203719.1 dicarboxylate transporter/tellurite-resistance protein TehA [Rhodanobacter thiooxydans]OZB73197.1 MAG: dicarboxylate transporter/tellurite-resistance protein TehA [Xanthomonadales bacterium 13-68-4]AOY69068.1 dicarboxylate transporter/tellurite-resistance protein TehA [Xanthomonas euvesicatoria pv. ves